MSLLGRSLVVLLLAGSGIGCSSSTPSSAGAIAQVASRATVEGKFAQYLLSPRGDIDGAVLEDGTIARFPPHAIAPDAASLRRGDAIRVEGEPTRGPGGTVLVNASITKGDVIIARADVPPPPPPGPPGPGGPRGPGPGGPPGRRGPPDADLAAMSATGTIRGFSTDPRGNVDGIFLSDGTTARAGRKARLETLGLKPGDTVTVTGRGGAYPQGKSLRIETIKLPTGEVRTVERPRAELLPTAHEGVVSTVLVNPHGDVDGLLLEDGWVLRMPPTPRTPQLVAGAKVRGEGDGRSKLVEARTLTLSGSSASVVGLAPPAAPPPPPTALPSVEDTSSVAKLVTSPDDDLDTLVLADGAIVRLPPALRDEAAGAITVGTKLTASGEGGTYGGVKAIHATRITLASGQLFSEPPPPAPPGVAP